jgi:DNA-directed RNA polymerase specialized sigma24 family protein
MTWWRKRSRPSADPARGLMERYCGGDADAFRELYTLLAPVVLADLGKRGCEGESATRVLESAFLTLHRDRSLYIVDADPRPWLLAIARRQEAALARRRAPQLPAQAQALSA